MPVDNGKMLIMGIAFVFTIAVELWIVKTRGILSGPEKRKQRAIEKGRVARGTLRRSSRIWTQNGNNDYYLSAYTYVVDGKEYQITGVRSEAEPQKTIAVYYDGNPAKGFVRGGTSSVLRVPLIILPFAVVFLLALLFQA